MFESIISRAFDIVERRFWLFFIIVAVIAAFNIFFNISHDTVNDWDEARYGVSAYEMSQNGNMILNTYLGKPEYISLKPPLGLWLMAASFKALGPNLLGLRLPSALSGFFVIILTMVAARKWFGSAVSVFAGIMLSTFIGFIFVHSSRSGDFDAGLSLLVIASVILAEGLHRNPKNIYAIAMLFSAAFLLKSFAAFQIPAILAAYWLISGKEIKLQPLHFVTAIIAALVPVAAWVAARYFSDGGVFLQKMINQDLFRSAGAVSDGHKEHALYYLYTFMYRTRLWYILFLVLIASPFVAAGYFKDENVKKHLKLVILWFLVPFILFNLAKTKCHWYILPIYPAAAIIAGVCLFAVLKQYSKKNTAGNNAAGRIYAAVLAVMFAAFFITAEVKIILKASLGETPEKRMLFSRMKNAGEIGPVKVMFNSTTDMSQSNIFMCSVIKGHEPVLADENSVTDYFRSGSGYLVIRKNQEVSGYCLKYGNYLLAKDDKFCIFYKEPEKTREDKQ